MTAREAGHTAMRVAGLAFRNPIVLASGTAGYGREVDDVLTDPDDKPLKVEAIA